MDFITERFDKFNAHRNLDPEAPETMKAFVTYLYQKSSNKVPLEEAEAFAIYSQYCFARKNLKTPKIVHEIADRKYQREYKKKKFKSLQSRKSKLYLANQKLLFKTDNVVCIVFAGYADYEDDIIETDFISIEEFSTKLGRCYRVMARSFKDPMLFTGHFMDRYAERNGLPIKREDNIVSFLKQANGMDSLTMGKTKTGHCTLPLKTGLSLGYMIKEVFIFKTFVDGDNLRGDQIIEAMVLKSKERDFLEKVCT